MIRDRARPFRRSPVLALILVLGVGALAGGCAARPDPADPEAVEEFRATNDPIEPFNRAMFFVNDGVDTLVLRPAAEAYRIFLPPEVRTAIRNVLGNMRTPVILVNDVLQGESQRAATTAGRFLINTTLGIGGILDRAKDFGLLGHTEDFGQTLAVWGFPEGPYLFIPVLGPSNPRDLVGAGVGVAMDPLTWAGGPDIQAVTITRTALTAMDTREGLIEPLDILREQSLDPYAALRSAYRQRRASEIANSTNESPAARGTGFGAGTGIEGPRR